MGLKCPKVKLKTELVRLEIHLHMSNLVLLPVKPFHLVFLQFLSGFYVLVIVTLQRQTTSERILTF